MEKPVIPDAWCCEYCGKDLRIEREVTKAMVEKTAIINNLKLLPVIS